MRVTRNWETEPCRDCTAQAGQDCDCAMIGPPLTIKRDHDEQGYPYWYLVKRTATGGAR